MNKHQIPAAVIAILAIAFSFVFWTWSVSHIPLPQFAEETVSKVETVIRDFFNAASHQEEVAVFEVEVEDLGMHFVTSVEKADLKASVIFQQDRVIFLDEQTEQHDVMHESKNVPEQILDQQTEPETIVEDSPIHTAANDELSQWGLNRAWSIDIPSLSIRAPIFLPSMKYWGIQAWDMMEQQMQVGLHYGTVAYPHSVDPGKVGSLIVAGHSSPPDEAAAQSAFGHIFARLPEIGIGEHITVTTAGTLVEYQVQEKIIVSPDKTSILEQQYDQSMLKLITCYPVGTTRDRMIILAKKVQQ